MKHHIFSKDKQTYHDLWSFSHHVNYHSPESALIFGPIPMLEQALIWNDMSSETNAEMVQT